jgi:hypothetical protein
MRYQLGYVYSRLQDYAKAYNVLVFFLSSENVDAKFLLGVCCGFLKMFKQSYQILLQVGAQNFDAALAGLQFSCRNKDFELCSKFGALIKKNSTGVEEAKLAEARKLVKYVKQLIDKEGGKENGKEVENGK